MNVIHIAIVDDVQEDRVLLIDKIDGYMLKNNLSYELCEYKSSEEFLNVFRAKDFDIVFMDIYMGGMNGIEAAAQLRAYDRECRLIFLSVSQEHIWQAVSLGICHYIIKPFTDTNFQQAMTNCCLLPEYTVSTLEVICDKKNLILDTGKILYINKVGRNILIHMTQQTFTVKGTFTQITQPLLEDKRYLISIQGVLVNMDKIADLTGNVFIMQNGEQVPINMRRKKMIQEAYQNYLMKQIRGVL